VLAVKCSRVQGNIQVVLLLDTPKDNTLGHRTGNHICILLAIPEIHHMALVGLVEHILTAFGKALVVPDVVQLFAPYATGVDEDAGLGEHLVKVLQGVDLLANELPSEFCNLLSEIGHV